MIRLIRRIIGIKEGKFGRVIKVDENKRLIEEFGEKEVVNLGIYIVDRMSNKYILRIVEKLLSIYDYGIDYDFRCNKRYVCLMRVDEWWR